MSNENTKPLNFFLVLCKYRKKLDKYMKLNRIRNKYIIDINEMLLELELSYQEAIESSIFKVMIFKKIKMAIENKKDIYYIPHINKDEIQTKKVLNIKEKIQNSHNFNLLYFYNDFKNQMDILNKIHEFDLTQILKDY